MEEYNVPIIRVKPHQNIQVQCVDIDGVGNQIEWHYHKLGTALVELAGKLRDKDHRSYVRSINKGMDYRM
jgi:hypothetical protein